MNQCVPSWDLDDNPPPPSRLDYEVAELTWENGQLAMHALKPTITPTPPSKYQWDRPRATGTLESIVNQATHFSFPQGKTTIDGSGEDLVPWFNHQSATATANTAAVTMDALVPNTQNDQESSMVGVATRVVGCATPVGSCSAATLDTVRVARVAVGGGSEWSSRADQSVTGSGKESKDSRQVTFDTSDRELGVGRFTSTSMGSPETTLSGKQFSKETTGDDHDSVCHSRPRRKKARGEADKKKVTGKSSVSTNKRSRAAAVHNQSERKRRDKINQRMKTLQKLVPNASKTDKASMLDEVIEYLKQLQAQVNMMSRMSMSPMMLPMALQQQQQQLQMSMMTPMGMSLAGMGMGMGNVMDMNTIARPNIARIHPALLHPTAFMPLTSWDGAGERMPNPAASVMPADLLSTFVACQQSQPINMDAYRRMAALYQQFQQPLGPGPPGSKN